MKKILASALTLLLALGSILTPSVASAASMPKTEENQAEVIADFDYLQLDDSLIKDGFDVAKPTISVRSNQTDGGGGGKKGESGWMLANTLKYSKKAQKFTVSAIGITISSIIPWAKYRVPLQIAQLFYSMYGSEAYVTQLSYYKWRYNKNGTRYLYQEKVVYKFYGDKARKKHVKTVSHIYTR
ncbi:hypothetical protein [Listeria grayi]|uniref:Uncharacterized protein n=2 Tax=Listeria grayi TaxID=1641 RepID=D7V071_LISGR|nr:hypothetical protein [Listeria grayi]EFI83824.1 hypothetical protein HMPREF0556_12509 [Listeria grayi DSM 20601]STY43077.1 Uncharacterised protein [Listeria grayi]